MFPCFCVILRMAENHFELRANFRNLYLRQLSMVQCGTCIYYDRPERSGEWIYLHGCASQLGKSMTISSIGTATVSSSRFILKSTGENKDIVTPCIKMDGITASVVSGNFLHNNGIQYQNSANGVVFGNHAYNAGGEIQIKFSRNFELSNNFSQGGIPAPKRLLK